MRLVACCFFAAYLLLACTLLAACDIYAIRLVCLFFKDKNPIYGLLNKGLFSSYSSKYHNGLGFVSIHTFMAPRTPPLCIGKRKFWKILKNFLFNLASCKSILSCIRKFWAMALLRRLNQKKVTAIFVRPQKWEKSLFTGERGYYVKFPLMLG